MTMSELQAHIYYSATHGCIRQRSLLDSTSAQRRASQDGRYLRCGHITVRFLGHRGHLSLLVVYGTTSGIKTAGGQGDELATSFDFGSMSRESLHRDAAASIAMLLCLAVSHLGLEEAPAT